MGEIKGYTVINELEEENKNLKEQLEELKEELEENEKELENGQKWIDELEENKLLIDVDMLSEYLDDRHLLTEELKNTIELWVKLHPVKDDLVYYSDTLWEDQEGKNMDNLILKCWNGIYRMQFVYN